MADTSVLSFQYAYVYAAINIYAWDDTYEEVKEQAKILDEMKVDGILVADGGVLEAVKEAAPNTDIHISTQANTISYHACDFWYKNGAKRVVLSRAVLEFVLYFFSCHKNSSIPSGYLKRL